MSKYFYKQVALSQLIISSWILYGFFDYLMDNDEAGFRGFGLFFYFIESCAWISGVGILAAILRLTWFKGFRKPVLAKTFIYVLSGVFNGYLVIIWTVAGVLGLMKFDNWLSIAFFLVALFSSGIILGDFYRIRSAKTPNALLPPSNK